MIVNLPKYRISYSLIPFKRNQDLIKIKNFTNKIIFSASVIDGWNNLDEIKGNVPGKRVASFVAENFPKIFTSLQDTNIQRMAEKTAKIVDEKVLKLYPAHASCVGAFLFHYSDRNIIVAVGSIFVYIWSGKSWKKLKEIGDYSLDPSIYPSDVSCFFGRGELKKQDPDLYKVNPDTILIPTKTPIFIGTDGTEEFISIKDLNELTNKVGFDYSEKFISSLNDLASSRKSSQNDDASIFVKF